MDSLEIIELLAKQLHENHRAICKSLKIKGPEAHDHGFIDCGNIKKEVFRKRARVIWNRSLQHHAETLSEAESNFQAVVFLHRSLQNLTD